MILEGKGCFLMLLCHPVYNTWNGYILICVHKYHWIIIPNDLVNEFHNTSSLVVISSCRSHISALIVTKG